MTEGTPQQRLINTRLQTELGISLLWFVADAREREMSWRDIAAEIHRVTREPVSHQTLITWFGDPEPPQPQPQD